MIDETFRWIDRNIKDEVDFVIWTGDSARHDNDDEIPRTDKEVSQLNELVAEKFAETFSNGKGRHTESPHNLSIPVVPTIGNNDIIPHNILKAGPNHWTKNFADIWKRFIPEEQRHTFVQGGWFTSEVIPGKLAAISLNTMFFFDKNNAVDGCESKREPGYEHMEWLRVQLDLLRERGMKAILVGHVPPARSGSKHSWDESCWQKYTLWKHQYRDVIVGSLYGHMNIDHFMLQDSRKVKIAAENVSTGDTSLSEDFSIQSRTGYLASLRNDWSKMPSPPPELSMEVDEDIDKWLAADDDDHSLDPQKRKKKKKFLDKIGGPWAERYSVSMVSPSVVPNYFPTLRVFEYNVTGLDDTADALTSHDPNSESISHPAESSHETTPSTTEPPLEESSKKGKKGKKKNKKNKKDKKKKKKRPGFTLPQPPSSTAPPGPAYSNQPLSWLSYTQYYANLTKIYERMDASRGSGDSDEPFGFEVEYDTKDDDVYRMKDLTVRSFFKLASRIAKGDPKENSEDGSLQLVYDDDDEVHDDEVSNNDDEVDSQKKKKKNKKNKKHKKKKKKRERNKAWITFLDRAFVGLLDPEKIDDTID